MNYVRKITVEDPNPPGEGAMPVHLGRLILFDDEEPRGCFLGNGVHVVSEANDGTVATLHVLADHVRTEPIPRPEDGSVDWDCFRVFIGEHEFLTPRGSVDPKALRSMDPSEFVPVKVYVAEVCFR